MELKFCPPLIGLTVVFEPPLDTKSYCWQVGGRPPSTCSAIHTVMHSVQYVHLYMVGARFLFLFSGYNHSGKNIETNADCAWYCHKNSVCRQTNPI